MRPQLAISRTEFRQRMLRKCRSCTLACCLLLILLCFIICCVYMSATDFLCFPTPRCDFASVCVPVVLYVSVVLAFALRVQPAPRAPRPLACGLASSFKSSVPSPNASLPLYKCPRCPCETAGACTRLSASSD